MAIVIERTITVNNDKSILDSPLYLYVGDGDITYLFTIKEKKKVATFGELGSNNSILNDINGYGEIRIYKPDGSEPAFTTRAEIVDDKLQAIFSYEHIDQLTEAGVHQLQIHLYDDDDSERNRFTIPPIELNVLFPVGTGPNIVGAAEVDYAEAAAETPIDTFLDDGSYNKTTWATGDKITSGKLNKIEAALYQINENNGDYVTSQELEVSLRSKANVSHTHSDYALKSSIPTVPTRTSQLTNDSGYVTESVVDNKINNAQLNGGGSNSSVDLSNYATKSEIPTKTSQLTNDSGYITSVPSEYVTDSELTAKNYASKDYVTSAINNAQLGGGSDGSNIDLSIYATKDDLYELRSEHGESIYTLYEYIDEEIAKVDGGNGSSSNVDLSDYATISYVNQEIAAIELTPGPKGDKGDTGEQGPKGDKGDKGADGTVVFEELTDEQKASLRGEQGPTGQDGKDGIDGKDFTYDMFTEEQLAALVGPKGDKGDKGEQGIQGIQGEKGDSFTYEDMTKENKADLTRGFVTCSDGITRIEVVNELPETEEDGVLYIVKVEV